MSLVIFATYSSTVWLSPSKLLVAAVATGSYGIYFFTKNMTLTFLGINHTHDNYKHKLFVFSLALEKSSNARYRVVANYKFVKYIQSSSFIYGLYHLNIYCNLLYQTSHSTL